MRLFFLLLLLPFSLLANDDKFADVKIERTHLAESVYMLTGAGGNIGVSAGPDGVLIIDDQFAPLAEKIAASVADVADAEVKYIVNTHYHGDHTGGNAWFKQKHHATVFAHDNVRSRLADDENHHHDALPVVTYEEGVKFHFNGDTIRVMHLPAGHTDGDSVVWFEKARVLHTGDLFFEGRFPYIDLGAGGTVAGYIANVERLISMLEDDMQIISGHGKLSTKADYQKSLDMMKETAAFVLTQKRAGMSLEQLTEKGLDEKWKDWSWNFITEEKWIATLYKGQ
ncbi:MBL fold metallo-hydrolase [Lacimicrobium alkaliphilum]|uniref:MBL fold metallo-hydrolase n=1 Tax=Lacimicrobium alkaliphilum TaxID=1526571 RepID=A0A0U3AX31_9ALTE|nr:MBL fold metallo-hydrolase [Lacimicrobium alkaliphilum]ALS97544.1 MBL fold metallo-hydrolase [Lacimicrobium alkaliphilum]